MIILRGKGGSSTAKALGEFIGCQVYRKKPRSCHDFIVNYGANEPTAHLNSHIIYNKYNQFCILKKNGISVPEFYSKSELEKCKSFPVLGRRIYHSQGKDIIFINSKKELYSTPQSRYDFLVKYYPITSEYRAHVLGKYVDFISAKVQENKDEDTFDKIRSRRLGWIQVEYEGEFTQQIIDIAKKSISALGFDFGAVDIIRSKDRLYVLEVNSAPSLEERKLVLYANFFKIRENQFMNRSR